MRAKLTKDQKEQIKELCSTHTRKEIAKILGVNYQQIVDCVARNKFHPRPDKKNQYPEWDKDDLEFLRMNHHKKSSWLSSQLKRPRQLIEKKIERFKNFWDGDKL